MRRCNSQQDYDIELREARVKTKIDTNVFLVVNARYTNQSSQSQKSAKFGAYPYGNANAFTTYFRWIFSPDIKNITKGTLQILNGDDSLSGRINLY